MKIQFPRGDTLPRAQVTAIGVITGVLSLVVVDVLFSGMALLTSAVLTLIATVVILAIVATVVATFTDPLQRLTDRVLADDAEEDRGEGEAGSA